MYIVYSRQLQITQTVHLILECPVVSYPERVNNAISTLNNVVKTDELVSIHLSVGWKIHVKPLSSNPLENSMNYFPCVLFLLLEMLAQQKTYLQTVWSGKPRVSKKSFLAFWFVIDLVSLRFTFMTFRTRWVSRGNEDWKCNVSFVEYHSFYFTKQYLHLST